MRSLLIEPGMKPVVVYIEDSLEELQSTVDGYIECIYPWEDEAGIVCNDSAKLIGLPLNRALYYESGQLYDVIAGPFLVVGLSMDGFADLTDEQVIRYEAMFHCTETFEFTKTGIKVMKNDE